MTTIHAAPRPILLPQPPRDTPLSTAFRTGNYTAADGTLWLKGVDAWFRADTAIDHDTMAALIDNETKTKETK